VPRAATPSASSDRRAWWVPESLRAELARPYGPTLTGEAADRQLRSLGVFASCGDVVTARAIALGRLPLVGVVDYRTQRNEPVDPSAFAPLAARRTVRVVNPPGCLTADLREAVRELVRVGGGLLVVDGEEDLASLALVESLPAGATVIYGIPGAGVSFVTVDATAKDHVRRLIDRMEPREVARGDPGR
jgi:GTP-dependent dephospho-CoA kinase